MNVGDRVKLTEKGVRYVGDYVHPEDKDKPNDDTVGEFVKYCGVSAYILFPFRYKETLEGDDPCVWPMQGGEIAPVPTDG